MICSQAKKTAPNSAWTNSSNGKILIDLKDIDMGRLVAKLGDNLNCSQAKKHGHTLPEPTLELWQDTH